MVKHSNFLIELFYRNDRFELDLSSIRRNLSLTRSKNFIFFIPLLSNYPSKRGSRREDVFQNFIPSIEFYLYSLVFVRSGTPGYTSVPMILCHVYLSMEGEWNGEEKKILKNFVHYIFHVEINPKDNDKRYGTSQLI